MGLFKPKPEEMVKKYISSNEAPASAKGPLLKVKDERIVAALISALLDKGLGPRRARAAIALGDIGDKKAVEPLLQVLEDSDDRVRRGTAGAFIHMPDERATKPLMNALLHDPDKSVRSLAANALGAIGNPEAVAALIQALNDMHEDVRWFASLALGLIGDEAALEALNGSLNDPSEIVRLHAKNAIDEIKKRKPVSEKE